MDNDIVFKNSCYGILTELISAVPCDVADVGVLGVTRYVVLSLLGRVNISSGQEIVRQRLDDFFARAELLEPTTDEVRFAAALEFAAHAADLDLDTGESLLCAVAAGRLANSLATGDKRAIAAFENLRDRVSWIANLDGKILCLEQLIAKLITVSEPLKIREAI